MSRMVAYALAFGLLMSSHVLAATFTVNSTDDDVDVMPGDGACATAGGACTLRAAIQEANASAGADTIDVPVGVFRLTRVGPAEDAAATGDLDVIHDLAIIGAARETTIIDGLGMDRVLDVPPGATPTLSIAS